jgi:hypothetical protein
LDFLSERVHCTSSQKKHENTAGIIPEN